MTNNDGNLDFAQPYLGDDVIYVNDGNTLPISHIGDISINTKRNINFKRCICSSRIEKNLLLLGKMDEDNSCIVKFTNSGFVIKD